jgi:pimeloyl-ACP methyl ester carboxylesterase/membrane protein DedA with SNARE-associated domain
VYLAALAASHAVRALHPFRPTPAPDETVIPVRPTDGAQEYPGAVRIAFRDIGGSASRRTPVMLVHGSPGDNGEVSGLAALLGRRRRAIAPDLPGFGGSDRQSPSYSVRAHAAYLLELLDSLGIRKVHLVGFSMGGGVVLEMEARDPERVASITMLSAIGAQEYELLGDYALNHAVHGLQLAGLWLLHEGVPHFGAFDGGMLSEEYARNFYDTDQRPLRGILERYQGPMLILHGERDVLVPAAAAREHARIVPQSELHIDPAGDHFAAFLRPGSMAGPIAEFLDRVDRGEAHDRAHAPASRLTDAARPFDPRSLPRAEGFALVIICLLLAAATLVSEDLTCITAGLMVARGTIAFGPATLACFAGIFGGDMLVFQAGRLLGRPLLRRPPISWFITPEAVAWSTAWLERQGAALVFATRLLPGTRLPTYFAAGILRTSFTRFALYFALACAVWTPLLVGVSAVFGDAAGGMLRAFEQHALLYLGVLGTALFLLLRFALPLATWRGRRLLLSRSRRITRWEFWPRTVFYPPVVAYIGWLAIRHGGLLKFAAANPGIPGGGFVGESKSAILSQLAGSPEFVARFELVPAALPPADRITRAMAFRERLELEWPVVLKPDIGERGSGVAVIRSVPELEAYLRHTTDDTIVQEYAPGREFGVFYVRRPGDARGWIFSITEKQFPSVAGDGARTLEELILADDRAVCMAPVHLRRHAARLTWVPSAGETVPLVELGTHCRGSLFLDGGWVETPAMAEAIDRISRGFDGFWFGRYDIRTPALEEFQAGRNFKIVELNGVTAEATAIYDPNNRLLAAYRTLFRQWRLLFEIADANISRGARAVTFRELWHLVRRHRAALGTRTV